jgi:hypothetical protein
VVLHPPLHAFAQHWGTGSAPVHHTVPDQGQVRTSADVGYIKRNALAGRSFPSFAALDAHIEEWTREVADVRVHGITGEPRALRFASDGRQG